jgi:hypothetical protein
MNIPANEYSLEVHLYYAKFHESFVGNEAVHDDVVLQLRFIGG